MSYLQRISVNNEMETKMGDSLIAFMKSFGSGNMPREGGRKGGREQMEQMDGTDGRNRRKQF